MARLKIVHIEDKYTSVKQLIELGKQKHYLLYDEIYEVLPDEVIGLPAEVDAIYRRFEELKIFVLDRPERYANREEIEAAPIDFDKKESEEHEVYAVDEHEKTNDPVRMYLREMGTVPLLTREGEVEIAKRIESGKNAMLRAISRTNMAAQEVARLGERLDAREIGVRDAVVFIEEEVTEEKLEAKIRETLKLIGKVNLAHEEYLAYRKHFVKLERKSRG